VGAWIETAFISCDGLFNPVAPCVGAWIETSDIFNPPQKVNVAPCVGAWIETLIIIEELFPLPGRALRGRVD